MSSKENNFKEQFKQALISTAKVISEDYKLDVKKLDKSLSNKKIEQLRFQVEQYKKYYEGEQTKAETKSSLSAFLDKYSTKDN